jgi:hypothetical protein
MRFALTEHYSAGHHLFFAQIEFRSVCGRAKRYRRQGFAPLARKSGKKSSEMFHFDGRVARITMRIQLLCHLMDGDAVCSVNPYER